MKEFHKHFFALGNVPRVAPILCAVLLILFCLAQAARAQDTGYISGTVTDKTGAAVAGASVEVTLANGSLTRNTTSNADGAYVASGLPAGTYNVIVTAKGFQKFQARGVVLAVGQKLRVDIPLTVGAVTEEVVVTGENVAQVETQSSEIGSTVTGKQVNELELNGRNFTQLVTLAPGVVSQTGSDEGTVGVYGNVSYSFNGGRTEYNNWEIDGGDNMDNGSNTTLNVYPNLEAIAEFKVLTSNYGAQYGRNGSGTVEVETKSGTSNWHGSAFYYGRNELFNARDWAQGQGDQPKAPYKKHDFGYTFGGPIYIPNHYNTDKKKTFFFWSQEWRREKNPSSFSQRVPSDAELGGNFSDLCPASGDFYRSNPTDSNGNPVLPSDAPIYPDCPASGQGPIFTAGDGTTAQSYTIFPGNQVPVDPTGQQFLVLIPHANGSDGGFPAYFNTVSLPTTWREELVRVDHNINDNERLTFRYIHDSWSTVTATPLWAGTSSFPLINTNFGGPGTSFVARLTSSFTPTLLNEFVASYTADHITLDNTGPIALPSGFAMGSLFDNGFGGKLPAIDLFNNTAYGGEWGMDTAYMPWKNANPTYTYRDNMTKIVGNHTLQFGAYFAAAQKNQENSVNVQGTLAFDTSSDFTTGNAFADMLMGNIGNYNQSNQQVIFYDRYKILEPYFQDDWRITKRLTLNLGLRWSFFGRYQERYNQEYGFTPSLYNAANAPIIDPDTGAFETDASGNIIGNPYNGFIQCGAGGAPTGCQTNKLMNPAPRFGFAWDPRGDGKWAVRGGYGIFFEHTNGNEANAESLQQGASPLIQSSTVYNIQGYQNIGAGGGLFFPISPYSIPDHVQWPYVQQWNLGVQHELPGNLLVTAAYVGSKGTHLTLQRDLNQLIPTLAADNPFAQGQPITDADCSSFDSDGTLANGAAVNGQAAIDLGVACGGDPTPFRPYYGYGTINRIETSANSIYHSLQVTARRSVGALTFSLAYTYSHSIDDSSDRYDGTFVDSYNLARSRASSQFDQRHALSISYVYALPFFKQPGLTHSLLGGWQVSGITEISTGTPVTITNGTNYSDNAGVGNGLGSGSFPDLVGNPNSVTSAEQAAASAVFGPLAFNPGAYALPTGLTFGDNGRNTIYLPGRSNFDFGAFKRFAIGEKAAFEFRWETFNLFNHTQYNALNTSMDCTGANNTAGDLTACVPSSGFLHYSGAHDARRMQFGLRFQF